MLLSGVAAFMLLSQSASPPVQCKLTRVDQAWEGTCPKLLGQNPTLKVSTASSIKTGRYRKDASPISIYAGEMRIPTRVVPVEIELYSGGVGILRPEGLTWLVVSASKTAGGVLEFDIDTTQTVPASDLDREIITRAGSILSSEAVWDRADDRECSVDDKTWSIYCALTRATMEVTGGIHHRRPAMEVVRQIVDERSKGRSYEHRLRDYNNDRSTTLSDVRSLFEQAMARMKR
jgi:hypothetical protein